MANVLTEVTPKLLAQGLMALRENSISPILVNRAYEPMAGQKGSTIDVPIPSAITAQAVTPAATPPSTADVAPTSVPIALDQWFEAPFYLTDKDVLEAMDGTIPMQASEAIKALINKVDTQILSNYVDFYGWYGTAGTTPFASSTIDATQIRKVLNQQLAPMDDRRLMLDPDAEAKALELRAFQDMSFSGSAMAILEGKINRKFGFDWFMNQNIPTHTAGTGASMQTAAAGSVGATTIAIDTGTGTLVVGDIITFAGHTQTYTITAAVADVSSATIAFQPALKAAVDNDALITKKASHVVNLAFHRDAIAFATRPLESDATGLGAIIQSAVDPISGLTLRLEVTREHKRTRFSYDMLWGSKVVRRELGGRLAG